MLPQWAASATQGPQMADRVVQRRKYALNHEISVLGGGLVSNPFYKGLTGTLGYTLHFNDFVGWEVLSATVAFDMDTNLKVQLLRLAALNGKPVKVLPEVSGYAASNLVIKPFYGKQALRDWAILHLELFVLLGPTGVMVANNGVTSYTFGGDWALGFRVWANNVVSLRGQIGQLIYLFSDNVYQEFVVSAGLSFNLGGDG